MTIPEREITFSSNRRQVATAEVQPFPAQDETSRPDAVNPDAMPRALVLSQTPGIAEMVAVGLNREGATQATALKMSLREFVQMPDLSLGEVSVCLFEIVQGDDHQIAALRALHKLGGGNLKILGLTSEVLTLATARALMDAGLDDVMPLQATSPQLGHATALGPVADGAIAGRGGHLHDGMIIAVAQTRGGIGATTFALNLATMLAKAPKRSRKAQAQAAPRVAIVDLDLQNGTLGASIDIVANDVFIEVLRSGELPDGAMLKSAMVSHATGFDVLPAPVEFVPLDCMRPAMMASLLDELRMTYDYVILDMPRTMVDWLEPVLARADRMYLLSDTAVHSMRQARRMIDFYSEDHVALPVDIIVSLERKPFTTSSAVKEAESFLNKKLTHWIPRDDRSAKKATDRGQTVLATKPKSPIAKAMMPLVADLNEYFSASQRRRA